MENITFNIYPVEVDAKFSELLLVDLCGRTFTLFSENRNNILSALEGW